MKYSCPICGDPNAYPVWVSKEPPEGCPDDKQWHSGGGVSIKSVAECKYQRSKAWQSAEFRKLLPDAFDGHGNIKPGRLADVLMVFGERWPEKEIRI